MDIIEQAERRRRWRTRRHITYGVIAVAGALALYHKHAWVSAQSLGLIASLSPFATATASKAKAQHEDATGDDDALLALERKAGLTPRGLSVGEGTTAKRYARRDVHCLARVVYHDGAGYGPEARAAMAQVALNRLATADFGTSLCEVVYRGMGRHFGCIFRETCRAVGSVPGSMSRWQEALTTATGVLKREIGTDAVGEATHFHKQGLRPRWLNRVTKTGEVDGLVLAIEKRTSGPVAAPGPARASGAAAMPSARRSQRPFDTTGRSALGGPRPRGAPRGGGGAAR